MRLPAQHRLLLAAAAAMTLLAIGPLSALAHPLGNFTVNRYSRIEVGAERVRVRYVLDMAEIPTFQSLRMIDSNGDGALSVAEQAAYADQLLAQIVRNLHLRVGDRDLALRSESRHLMLVPGQAGLQTLRLEAWLDAPGAAPIIARAGEQGLSLDYRDDNDPGRVGWREIVVQAQDGVSLAGGDARTRDVSDELRTYPEDLLSSPLDLRHVTTQIGGTSGDSNAGTALRQSASVARVNDGFSELFGRLSTGVWTPAALALALGGALALGAMHALSPGHGKTIVGAYLVGAHGTARHALVLGVTVTVVHTAGVFTLGLATLGASRYFVPESVYPWMSLGSGLLVLGMGLSLLRSRLRGLFQAAPYHSHFPEHEHDSPLTHSHGLGTHTHDLPGDDGRPVTWRSLLALGISGGLLPCPSALVVMLGAIALHQVTLGLLLIVAFSAGLAGTLMAIGLLMVFSGRAAGRLRLAHRFGLSGSGWSARIARALPAGSAAVVALAGLALSVEAVRQLGVAIPFPLYTPSQMAALTQTGALALLGTALVLGLRHGVDWDHIAAIADLAGGAGGAGGTARRANVGLALLYALGHGLVVIVLGLAALWFGAILPEWVDPLMERVVGFTLLALGACVLYSLVDTWRTGEALRLRSRWMLLFAGLRHVWRAFQRRLHGHAHDGLAHSHQIDQYGPRAAFGIGLVHGIGAETGTQVLIIAAVGGAASHGLGVWMLLAFVLGLLLSNAALALVTSSGFATSGRARSLYVGAGGLAAAFSLVVGSAFVLGAARTLPDLSGLLGG